MKVALLPFLAIAALGLLLSIVAHVLSLLGVTVLGGDLVWSLHMGIFIVWLPTVLLFVRISRTGGRKEDWKILLSGCPRWARYALYSLFAYAIVNFLYCMHELQGHPQPAGEASPSVVRAFSGHWMIFYGAAFAALYSVTRRPELLRQRKCAIGHNVSHSDSYCPTCGRALEGRPIDA